MPTTAPQLTGQDINVAARATRLVLIDALEPLDTTFEQWITINQIGSGLTTDEPAARARLSTAAGLSDEVIDEVLDGLEASGIVARGDDRFSLSLTDAGAAFFARGQAILAEITASLYGGMDPDELEIARRVLVEVTARAEARLVG